MKTLKHLSIIFALVVMSSCASVQISSDYDKSVDFEKYKTYAFHKEGVDKVEIHDLDKKRILKAIQAEMDAKGMKISENPDILISFSTKERQNVNVDHYGFGYGWGWGPFGFGTSTARVSKSTEGTLFIDIIDAKKNEMIWQGVGEGALTRNIDEKEQRIKEFVSRILSKYPPEIKK